MNPTAASGAQTWLPAARARLVQAGTRMREAWFARQPRERMALLLSIAVLSAGVIDMTLWTPGRKEQAKLQAALAKEDATLSERRATLTLRRANAARLQAEEEALRKRIAQADSEVELLQSSVTPGPQMLKRLRQYSTTDNRLKVVSLNLEPAEPVLAGNPALFRLPVVVTLEGDYAALADYLHKLETTGGLRWRSLDLQTQTWPTLRLKLKVFTLGEQASWPI